MQPTAAAAAAEEEDEALLVPTRPGRGMMYALVSLQGFPHWTIRSGLAAWVPILVRDLGLSEADRAMLLAAWFPGSCVWRVILCCCF